MQTLPDKPTALAEFLSISIAYASLLLTGNRPWTRALAITVYRKTGEKIGPLASASDEEIEVLERFETTPESTQAAA